MREICNIGPCNIECNMSEKTKNIVGVMSVLLMEGGGEREIRLKVRQQHALTTFYMRLTWQYIAHIPPGVCEHSQFREYAQAIGNKKSTTRRSILTNIKFSTSAIKGKNNKDVFLRSRQKYCKNVFCFVQVHFCNQRSVCEYWCLCPIAMWVTQMSDVKISYLYEFYQVQVQNLSSKSKSKRKEKRELNWS